MFEKDNKCTIYNFNRGNFNYKDTAAYAWLVMNFGTKLKRFNLQQLCVLFSLVTNRHLNKEYLKHKDSMIFWLNANLDSIKNFLKIHDIQLVTQSGEHITLKC